MSVLPPGSTFKDLDGYREPTRIIQDYLPISKLVGNVNSICKLNSLLPCHLTNSQVLGVRAYISWGVEGYCLIHYKPLQLRIFTGSDATSQTKAGKHEMIEAWKSMQSVYVMDYTSAFGRGRVAGNICCLHHPARAKLCKTERKRFELRASRSGEM